MASDTPRYRLLEPIGRGRIGQIHLAEAIDPGTRPALAAVALLDPRLTASSEDLALLREQATLLGRLNHVSIARVLDLSRFPEGWGLIMEYARGLDLDLYRIAGPLPPRVAAEIIERTATALRVALESPLPGEAEPLGLCHGDLVPSLVRLDVRGMVKVCGFGLSAQDGPDPHYAAPERLHGEASPRADIYSLALIAVRLLSGRDLPPPPRLPAAQRTFVAGALDAVHQRLIADLKGGTRYSVEPLLMMLEAMLDSDPSRRPSAQRVQLGSRSLLGVLPGAWLEPWAAQRVPELYERSVAFARTHDPAIDRPEEPEEAEDGPTGDPEEPTGEPEEAAFAEVEDEEESTGEPEPEDAEEEEPLHATATLPGVRLTEIEPEPPAAEPDIADDEAPTGDGLDDIEDVSEHLEDSVPDLDTASLAPLDDLPVDALSEPEPVPEAATPAAPRPEVAKPAAPQEPTPAQPAPTPAKPAPKRRAAPWWVLGFLAIALFVVIALWMSGLLGEVTPPVPAPAPQEPAAASTPPAAEEPAPPAEAPTPAAEEPAPAAAPVEAPASPAPRSERPRRRAPEPAAPAPAAAPVEKPAQVPVEAPVGQPAPAPAPAAEPEEKPAPTPAAGPVEKPAPAPAAASGQATVHLEGDATKVQLQAGGGSFPVGLVPPGTYNVSAWFGGDAPVPAGTLQVTAGEDATLRCSSVMLRCSKQ